MGEGGVSVRGSRRAAAVGDLASRLDEGIVALGLSVDTDQSARLLEYLGLLHKWNAVYNLTSVREIGDMLVVHLLDSLSILPLVDRYLDGALLDVGSGAGLPGIPLAIARPALVVHSVDAVAKKIGFQLQVKAALELRNFYPQHQRVEAVTLVKNPSLIVCRAYAELPLMVASFAHLVDDATVVLAMKGLPPTEEITGMPADWRVETIEPLDVPFLGARRCAVVLRRAG